MLDYIIALVVIVLVAAVPALRRAALSVLGLSAIAAVAIAGIALPVWGLYEAKSWLMDSPPAVAGSAGESGGGMASPEGAASETVLSREQEARQRHIAEERQRQAEEQRRIEEELQRVAKLADDARAVVENDRQYAEVAATSPRIRSLDDVSTDLIAIRIPSWRDEALAEREKELIRAWLISIGLTPEETAMIFTAKAWGSVYDLWRREITAPADKATPEGQAPAVADSETPPPAEPVAEPEPEPAEPEPEPPAEPEPAPPPEPDPAPATAEEPDANPWAPLQQAERPAAQSMPQPRQVPPPPRRTPERRRPPAPEREVGPFGY